MASALILADLKKKALDNFLFCYYKGVIHRTNIVKIYSSYINKELAT